MVSSSHTKNLGTVAHQMYYRFGSHKQLKHTHTHTQTICEHNAAHHIFNPMAIQPPSRLKLFGLFASSSRRKNAVLAIEPFSNNYLCLFIVQISPLKLYENQENLHKFHIRIFCDNCSRSLCSFAFGFSDFAPFFFFYRWTDWRTVFDLWLCKMTAVLVAFCVR